MAAPSNFLMSNRTPGNLSLTGPLGVQQDWALGETKVTGTRMERYSPHYLTKLGSCDADGNLDSPQKTDPAVDDTAFPAASVVTAAQNGQAARSISGADNTGWQVTATDSNGAVPTLTSAVNAGKLDVVIGNVEAGAKASLVNQGLTYQAKAEGIAGNAVQIVLVNPGVDNATTDWDLTDGVVTITLKYDTGAIIETASTLVTAYATAPAPVKALINITGSGSTALTALVATKLAGGIDQSDFGALTLTRTAITLPAIGAETSVGSGELVLARLSDRYTITLTDGDSDKVCTLESFAS